MDYSPPGSSVLGMSQARVLEWVATPSPGDLPDPGIKHRSPAFQAVSCILYQLSHQGSICDTYFTSELLEQESYPFLSTDLFFFFKGIVEKKFDERNTKSLRLPLKVSSVMPAQSQDTAPQTTGPGQSGRSWSGQNAAQQAQNAGSHFREEVP